jgi:antitoxin (DNA-binding transcriptional repressor) of toxin-antitoxin stability system
MASSTAISKLPAVTATDIKNSFASVWDRMSAAGAIAITRHEKPRAVLVTVERFEELIRAGKPDLDRLTEEFDGLLASMQTSKARRGMAAAFKATPAQLGEAAVAAARKRK